MGKKGRANTKRQSSRPPTTGKRSAARNEGEGSRSADRNYREGVAEHLQSGRSEQAAKDAERALDGDEADELGRAEEEGKRRAGAHPNPERPVNPDPD
jgi:hypothetical protein